MSTFISAGGGATDIALRSLKATKLWGPSTSSKNWCINWWFSGCHQRLNWWINNWWINWWLACIKSQLLIFERKVWSSVHADPDEKKLPVQRTADRCRLRQKATLKASPCSGGYSTVAMDPDSWWLRPFCWPFVSYFWMNCDDRRLRDVDTGIAEILGWLEVEHVDPNIIPEKKQASMPEGKEIQSRTLENPIICANTTVATEHTCFSKITEHQIYP